MTDVSETAAKLPYLRFVCGYDLCTDGWLVAVYWRPNPYPQPLTTTGVLVYLHGIEINCYRWLPFFRNPLRFHRF